MDSSIVALVVLWLLLLGGAAAFLAWRFRLGRPPRKVPRYPIVLVHGLLGFDEIGVGPYRRAYFFGVDAVLEQLGVKVYRPKLRAAASVPARAEQLAAYIAGPAEPRVNLVAHSLGGLDARYAISRLGLSSKVAALVTIGTPHRGTPLAEVGSNAAAKLLRGGLPQLGLDLDALDWLTPEAAARFNAEVADHPWVVYLSVAGKAGRAELSPLLWPSHKYLEGKGGANDGVVPRSSQVWGAEVLELDLDHWAQIGWSGEGDVGFYGEIAALLARRGG